jgi:hypothetical protein
MTNGEAMKNDLPKGLYLDDTDTKSNKDLDIVGKQLDNIESSVLDLEKQFSIKTCTWGLEIYEKEYNVSVSPGATTEERRSNAMAKARGGRGTNPSVIKSIAESYINGEVDIDENFPNYEVKVTFIGERGVPSNLDDIKEALRANVHGHLVLTYKFTYLIWSELDSMNLIWTDFDDMQLTWDELEVLDPTKLVVRSSTGLTMSEQ